MRADGLSLAHLQYQTGRELRKTDQKRVDGAYEKVVDQKTRALDKTNEAAGTRADGKRDSAALQCVGSVLAAVGGVLACIPPIGTIIGAVLLVAAAICFAVAGGISANSEEAAAGIDRDAGQSNLAADQSEREVKKAESSRDDQKANDRQHMSAMLELFKERQKNSSILTK